MKNFKNVIFVCLIFVLVGCGKSEKVGVAVRRNQSLLSFTATLEAIKLSGSKPVVLDFVTYDDFDYDNDGELHAVYKNDSGMLKPQFAELIKQPQAYKKSNVQKVLGNLKSVVFPGGEDISPSLLRRPQAEANLGEEIDAKRDVSDYLLMSYCLDNDIPILCICRGMQMLGVVSGGGLIQDIDTYLGSLDVTTDILHRMSESPNRDFAVHDIMITDKNSALYDILKTDKLKNVMSWHHLAVTIESDALFEVTALTPTGSVDIIEAIERKDKKFALGVQFHPEINIVRQTDGCDIYLNLFNALVNAAKTK